MGARLQYQQHAFYSGELQAIRPDADISGSWTPSTGGDMFAVIDEQNVSDADFITSSEEPSADAAEVSLESATDPEVHDQHVVHYRIYKVGDPTVNIQAELYQGATQIGSWTHNDVGTEPITYSQPLSAAEAANITNYADLRIRFTANP